MGRPYSEKFLLSLSSADSNQIGVQLGRLLVDANIPATYIASALGVTRMTVYSWMRGQDIRRPKRKVVEAIVDLMKKDFEEGILPVPSRFDAKLYVQDLVGTEI